MVRTILNFVLAGVVIGGIATAFLYPRLAEWNNTPGSGQALCDCAAVTRSVGNGMAKALLIGGGAGAALGLIVGIPASFATRKKRKAREFQLVAKALAASAPPKATDT